MPADSIAIARASYEAYVSKDRAAIEALIAPGFHFTSPLDNRIDRATYFERCWPNAGSTDKFEYVRLIENGDEVIVTYELTKTDGKRFRNTEVLTFAGDKLTKAEVYFGWSIPHQAAEGRFVDAAAN